MPYNKLTLGAGVISQATQLLAKGGWWASNLIRWRDGFLEKLYGWTRLFNQAVSGVARSLHAFQDLDLNTYLAIGTNQALYLYDAATGLQNITPVSATENLTGPFSTTLGSTTVGVADTAHGASLGGLVDILVPAAVGGIVIQGLYIVTNVVDADNYEIDVGVPALSTATGGDVPEFTTTNGSDIVGVELVNHGYSSGQVFEVQVSTTVGGITLFGAYLITSVTDADNFEIQASSGASSDATGSENGGDVRILYLLAPGPASTTTLVGYGSGGYGLGPYGIGGGGSGAATNPLRIWWLDNFGENLVANPTNGALYEWLPPKASANFAQQVIGAPTNNISMFVAMPQAQVIIPGAEIGGIQDPLLVRWCDNGNYTVWTASATNQAGSYRLSKGSTIIGGLQGPQAAYIWTDTDLWQMQYQGPPFVYSFQLVSSNTGMVAPKAATVMGRDVYWLSRQGFFMIGTTAANRIPCPVWDEIFANMDQANIDKCIAAANTQLGEVSWYYPSVNGTGEIDSYVKMVQGPEGFWWDYGSLVRTAWIDYNLWGYPLGVDETGLVQQHENGYDDDGSPMTGVMAKTGFFDISDGLEFSYVDQVVPDFVWRGTSPVVTFTVFTTDWPGAPVVTHGPYTLTETTTAVTLRARARQIAFQFEMSTQGTWFRVGAVRIRSAPSGRV